VVFHSFLVEQISSIRANSDLVAVISLGRPRKSGALARDFLAPNFGDI
jgi:hypothetical protein